MDWWDDPTHTKVTRWFEGRTTTCSTLSLGLARQQVYSASANPAGILSWLKDADSDGITGTAGVLLYPGGDIEAYADAAWGIRMITQPTGASAWYGDSVTLSVGADSRKPLTYQWRKDGVDIPNANSSSYTINPLTESADYDVVIANGDVTKTSAGAHVKCRGWVQKTPAVHPSARADHGMAYDRARGVIVLFGGNTGTPNGETWEYDVATSTWTQVSTSGPAARYAHAMAGDDYLGGIAAVFGGNDGSQLLYDGWVWNGSTWIQTADGPNSSSPPVALQYGDMVFDNCIGVPVLMGGFDGLAPSSAVGLYAEGWWYSWEDAWGVPPPVGPFPRYQHTASTVNTYINWVFRCQVLFGGTAGNGPLGDTWVLTTDPMAWTQLTPANSPPARYGAAMSSDWYTAYLFGGYDDVDYLGDTWKWDGTNWTELLGPGPSPRKGQKMVFDFVHQVFVLFGGQTENGLSDETWVFDPF